MMMKRLSKRLSSALFGESESTVYPEDLSRNVEMHAKVSVSILPDETVKIPVPGPSISVDKVLLEVCRNLNIGQQHVKNFTLFQETSSSFRKPKSTEYISSDTKGLILRKWCFDLEEEKSMMKMEGALTILYHQAKHDVASGRILPDPDVKAKLTELITPKIDTYFKYVSLCQEIKDYFAVEFKNCDLCEEFKIKSFELSPGIKFSIVLFDRGIRIRVSNKDFLISWRKISSWSQVEDDRRIRFEVYSPSENTYSVLVIETRDAHYMLAVLMQLIKNLQDVLDGPMFETSDLIMDSNGTIVKWNNVLFATRRFNAEDELSIKYEDLTS